MYTKYFSNGYSPLINMFNGLTKTIKTCICCNSKNIIYEPFITLQISIPIQDNTEQEYNIYECLNNITTNEQLDNDNKVECDFCGLFNKSYTKSLLWKTPEILVIHIKRFIVNSYGKTIRKLNNKINYPIYNLDLLNYFDDKSPYKNDSKYDLFGVNIHYSSNNSIDSGHYVSKIKNIMNNKWCIYNDSSSIIEINDEDEINDENAYLLFYCRQNNNN